MNETSTAWRSGGCIPIDRLVLSVITLMAAPYLVLYAGISSFGWIAAIAAALLIVLAAALRQRAADSILEQISWKVLFLYFSVSILLFALGGEGGFFYANPDWIVRNAALADLVQQPWLPTYTDKGQTLVMRAPIGMYMLPAIFGKLFGLRIAHLALLIQNSVFFTLLLALAGSVVTGKKRRFVFLVVFVAFSGLDIVPHIVSALIDHHPIPSHLEWWNRELQYSSTITLLFWAPPHALPAWAFAVFVLARLRNGLALTDLLILFALLPLWSPFAFIGAAPFALFFFLSASDRPPLGRILITIAFAGLTVLPAIYYLHADSGAFALHVVKVDGPFLLKYLAFCIVELGSALWICSQSACSLLPKSLMTTVVLMLFALPFFALGDSKDLVMRSSVPALALLAFACGHAMASGDIKAQPLRLAICLLILGSFTGLFEIRRSLVTPPQPISNRNMLDAWICTPFQTADRRSYLARAETLPDWVAGDRKPSVIPFKR